VYEAVELRRLNRLIGPSGRGTPKFQLCVVGLGRDVDADLHDAAQVTVRPRRWYGTLMILFAADTER
jgi:hypothetical protein